MSLLPLFIALATGLVVSSLLTPWIRNQAQRRGLYAEPVEDRWHRRPVPRLGGAAMMLALLAGTLAAGAAGTAWPLLLGAGLMFLLGLADDARPVRPATKLVGQVLIAATIVSLAPPLALTGIPAADTVLALLWIVGITNAFNLLDNIDGLAAGIAVIAGCCYLTVLLLSGGAALLPVAAATAALVGAALGFLIFNFQPASIFMGDSGSHLLGAFLAGACLFAAPEMKPQLIPVTVVPVLILLIPIFDTAFVTLTRRLTGRSAFTGGRDHVSHRLVALGIGERRAVLVLYLLTALGGLTAISLHQVDAGRALLFVGFYLVLLCGIGVYLGHVESSHRGAAPPPAPLVSELTYRYRVYEVLLDVALIACAYYAAFAIRFQGAEFAHFQPFLVSSFPLVMACQLAALWSVGKYRQRWGTLGAAELATIGRGILVGVTCAVVLVLYLYRFEGFSRSVFVFDALILAVLLVGSRVAISSVDEYVRHKRTRGRKVLIYGAGRGGSLLVKEVMQNPDLGLMPLGFLDDDPSTWRQRLEGLPVHGGLDSLPGLLASQPVGDVLISIRDLPPAVAERIVAICQPRGVVVRRMRFALEELRRPESQAGVLRFSR